MMAIHKAISIVNNNVGLNLTVPTISEKIIEKIKLTFKNRKKEKNRKIYNKCFNTVNEIFSFHLSMNILLVKVTSHQPNGACPRNEGAAELSHSKK